MPSWELQLTAAPSITRETVLQTASPEEGPIQSMVSTQWVSLSHHCKVEKLLGQTIISWGPSVVTLPEGSHLFLPLISRFSNVLIRMNIKSPKSDKACG